jgi:hypothetical protein
MCLATLTLRWIPEGTLHKKTRRRIGEESSLDQEIEDESPEEILSELRLLVGKIFSGALTAQPQVRVMLTGNDNKQIKPISAIIRWLRGDQRCRLAEYDAANDILPLYLDFVTEAGESHGPRVPSSLGKHELQINVHLQYQILSPGLLGSITPRRSERRRSSELLDDPIAFRVRRWPPSDQHCGPCGKVPLQS